MRTSLMVAMTVMLGFSSINAFADCTNFSGIYQVEGQSSFVKITQPDCVNAVMSNGLTSNGPWGFEATFQTVFSESQTFDYGTPQGIHSWTDQYSTLYSDHMASFDYSYSDNVTLDTSPITSTWHASTIYTKDTDGNILVDYKSVYWDDTVNSVNHNKWIRITQ